MPNLNIETSTEILERIERRAREIYDDLVDTRREVVGCGDKKLEPKTKRRRRNVRKPK